jgi:hypothetical protein
MQGRVSEKALITFKNIDGIGTHAATIWEKLRPPERLKRSWKLRRRSFRKEFALTLEAQVKNLHSYKTEGRIGTRDLR